MYEKTKKNETGCTGGCRGRGDGDESKSSCVVILTVESNYMALWFKETFLEYRASEPLGLLIKLNVCPCVCV